MSFPRCLSDNLTWKLEHFPSESNLENPAISMQILKITFFIKMCGALPNLRGKIDHRISWASGNRARLPRCQSLDKLRSEIIFEIIGQFEKQI